MVEIKPFRGLYYSREKAGDLERLVTPPHDVISPEDQQKYYENSEYNVVRLILGKKQAGDSEEDNQYTRAKKFLDAWLEEGVLERDAKPAIYAYEQEFRLDNGCTKKQLGFIALVKIEPFEKKVILPHEKIVYRQKEDRLHLMRACRANLSLVITVYSDKELYSNKRLSEKAVGEPLVKVSFGKHYCIHRVWAVHDKEFIQDFTEFFKQKKLYIADGHHRYTTALEYHTKYDKSDESAYMMMFMLNMDGDGVTILPAHRVLKGLEKGLEEIKDSLAEYFDVEEFESSAGEDFFSRLEGGSDAHSFGLYAGHGRFYLMRLKDRKVMTDLTHDMPEIWRHLDVIILHRLVLNTVLGVDVDEFIEKGDLVFVKERAKVMDLIDSGGFEAAFFLNPTRMQQVMEVAEDGERMPQKSTYFYPKPLSGLIINKFD